MQSSRSSHARSNAPPNPSPRSGGIVKPSGQLAACDRCRGQKLKCHRNNNESQCQRCQKANVVCVVPTPKPMGRPPRARHSSCSSLQHHGNGRDEAFSSLSGSDMLSTTASSSVSSNEDVLMIMAPNDNCATQPEPFDSFVASDLFDDAFDDFFVSNPQEMTSTIASPTLQMGAHSSHPFAQPMSSLPFAPFLGSPVPQFAMAEFPMDHQTNLGETANDEVMILSQLADLNVAIVQHPLQRRTDVVPRGEPATEHFAQSNPDLNAANASSSEPQDRKDICMADLGLGKLLVLTQQLEAIIQRVCICEEDGLSHTRGYSRSSLMAFSCYANLSTLYLRAMELLRQVTEGSRKLRDGYFLMPGLLIDGFNLNGCLNIKLDLLIHFLGMVQARIRRRLRRAEAARSANGLKQSEANDSP